MVLTDKDFGRAYLTEGWARRFIQDLFLKFTVLFVGYSHNDPADALPCAWTPAVKRLEGDDLRWRVMSRAREIILGKPRHSSDPLLGCRRTRAAS